jgi:metal-responsive CopG/Arc/MetJ family transcriptional regulator
MERFAISLSDELACDFDAFISELAYNDHAETARDLIRAAIEEHGLRLPETAQADRFRAALRGCQDCRARSAQRPAQPGQRGG